MLGTRRRGRPISDVEQKLFLLDVTAQLDDGRTREQAIRKSHEKFGAGRDTLRQIIQKYDPHKVGAALPPSTPSPPTAAGVRIGRPRKPLLPTQAQHAIDLVNTAFKEGRTIMYTELYAEVRVKALERGEEVLSLPLFRKRMRTDHNLRFLRSGKVVPKAVFGAAHQRKRAEFVFQYSIALEEQALGTAVVVYMDESFVHQHHRRSGSVVNMADQKQWVARRKAAPAAAVQVGSRGQMFMLIHAMTEDGLLYGKNSDGTRVEAPPGVAATCANAEALWKADKQNPDPDYHNHITSDTCNGRRGVSFLAASEVPGQEAVPRARQLQEPQRAAGQLRVARDCDQSCAHRRHRQLQPDRALRRRT